MDKTKAVILGSGKIGTDLLVKIRNSPYLECTLFIGRNYTSDGMIRAQLMGVPVSDQGIHAIVENPDCCTIVFDATSAKDAQYHSKILTRLGKTVINMTPARLGNYCIPAIGVPELEGYQYFNMVTCGGQAAIPIAYELGRLFPAMEYLEIVSSISSSSAGPATRLNLDEYVETTEHALCFFSGARTAKAILILNPAVPYVDMQTTIFAKIPNPDMVALTVAVENMAARVASYVPGYQLLLSPAYANGVVTISIKVEGKCDYLPKHAGNLDIICCAAIAVAEGYAKKVAPKVCLENIQ